MNGRSDERLKSPLNTPKMPKHKGKGKRLVQRINSGRRNPQIGKDIFINEISH